MKCPNCGFEAPDGTPECLKCQVVFSKLEESAVKKALLGHANRIKEPPHDPSTLPRLIVLFLISIALLYFVRQDKKEPVSAASPAGQAVPADAGGSGK